MIRYTENISGKHIPHTICPRRPGDIASVYCDPNLASERLGWTARRSIVESIENGWRYTQNQM
jgi:UDP-glucose 4-epimerase